MSDTTPDELKLVPLNEHHEKAGGKMVPFAGFRMPLQYEGIKHEHLAVRNHVGLFDVSHMGEVEIRGEDAIAVADSLVTNDVYSLEDGQALYTVMCHEHGGIVDDLLVYRLNAEHILLCVNAANRDKDFAHIKAHARGTSSIEDTGDSWAQLALQGPKAQALLQKLTSTNLDELKYFYATFGEVAGQPDVLISRTGYTGEHGYELYIPAQSAAAVFEAIVDIGDEFELALCGLGARDTLRLEAKLHLYGQDLTDETNPLEAGLQWTVKLQTPHDFVGKQALLAIKEAGVTRRLRGFILDGKGVIRQGYEILNDEGDVIGELTSGSYSYMLDTSVGMGYVLREHAGLEHVKIQVRKKQLPAQMTKKAFYKKT